MKKIIIIEKDPYKEEFVNNLFFENRFEKDQFEFEYWSIIDIKISKNKYQYNDQREHKESVIYFNSINEIKNKIKTENLFYCFFQIPLNFKTLSLFKVIKNKSLGIFNIKYHEAFYNFDNKVNQSKYKLLLKNPNELFTLIKNKLFLLYLKYSKINNSVVTFSTGRENQNPQTSISHFDYYTYIKVKDFNPIIAEEYIVFLDTYLANHPDFKAEGIKTIEANRYYEIMNSFFDDLERNFKCKVIIAAHPRSNYSNEFNNRLIIKEKTAELVSHSKFVVKHLSASITFPIFFNKPVVFIYTNEFLNKSSHLYEVYKRMQTFSNILDSSIINLDKEKLKTIKPINDKAYMNLKNNYLLSINLDLDNYNIIKQHIK